MKYKQIAVNSNNCPRWLADALMFGFGVECQVPTDCNSTDPLESTAVISGYVDGLFLDSNGYSYRKVKPIPVWEPQKGDIVIAWNQELKLEVAEKIYGNLGVYQGRNQNKLFRVGSSIDSPADTYMYIGRVDATSLINNNITRLHVCDLKKSLEHVYYYLEVA